MDLLLQTENLHKQFGGIHATCAVNLEVRRGEIHAVIGPNGAGKTTLVAQLSGALAPDRGRIIFSGQDITAQPCHQRARLGLARSFQLTSIIAPMTLLENVMLAAQIQRGHSLGFWRAVRNDTRLIEDGMDYLAQVGLDARADVVAAEAAHGEQRRLELALVLALRPKLLLLDEPFAGMGSAESQTMVALLQRLKTDSAPPLSMLLVEHDTQAVFALADRVSVLCQGRLIASGAPQEVRANPEVQRAYLGET